MAKSHLLDTLPASQQSKSGLHVCSSFFFLIIITIVVVAINKIDFNFQLDYGGEKKGHFEC